MGDTVLVTGAGPIGLLTVQVAIASGASQVFVTDVSEARLVKAKEVGATQTFDAKDKDIPTKIREMTGHGVDVYIDAAGVQASFDTGIKSLRNGGTAVLVALFSKNVSHDALDQALRELTIKGIIGYRNIFQRSLRSSAVEDYLWRSWSPGPYHWTRSWKRALKHSSMTLQK